MLTPDKFEAHANSLLDLSVSHDRRRVLLTEVRDSMESLQSQDQQIFLKHFLLCFSKLLTSITPPQIEDNVIHKCRGLILEIIQRMTHFDIPKQTTRDLLPLVMRVAREDNEENAVVSMHIIFELHKRFRPHLEDQVKPFLEHVRLLYSNLPKTVEAVLLSPNPPSQGQRMLKSSQSFKVVTECPLIVMFVFQLYPKGIRGYIQSLLPLMVKAIEIQQPQTQRSSKGRYHEFIATQVKTVTFLAYLLKQYPEMMKLDNSSIPGSIVQLLQSCPDDAIVIRRELLVATRHMIGGPFRQAFSERIDVLLNERVLVGNNRITSEALRPLAYAFLGELVHGVRLNLNLHQVSRVIALFATNLHDPKFNFPMQTTSVRIMLNLIEGILRRNADGAASGDLTARHLLIRIMSTMVDKYASIAEQVPHLLEVAKATRQQAKNGSASRRLSEEPPGDPLKEINDCKVLIRTLTLGMKTVVWTAINIGIMPHPSNSGLGDTPALTNPNANSVPFATNGARQSQGSNSGNPQSSPLPVAGRTSPELLLLEDECEIVARLLHCSPRCFLLYNRNVDSAASNSVSDTHRSPGSQSASRFFASYSSVSQEEKEIFEQFAHVFTVLDVKSFQAVFGLRMPKVFDYIVSNPSMLIMFQLFLADNNIGKYFTDILLNFAVSQIGILGSTKNDKQEGSIMKQRRAEALLRIFRMIFASITEFPANEPILRLHLGAVVRGSLRHAICCEDPLNYLQLIRALFKSLAKGKQQDFNFEYLYRDFMPLIEPLFSGLLKLYDGPHRVAHGQLIIELCLMVPARPSTIFPYLSMQLKPIVWALDGSKVNVQNGLSQLEYWVDMLQPSYLQKLLEQVEPNLTQALHRHLRPKSVSPFGTSALRILGKLGARSRLTLSGSVLQSRFHVSSEPAIQLHLLWADGSNLPFNVGSLAEKACDVFLKESNNGSDENLQSTRQTAWNICRIVFTPFLGLQNQDTVEYAAPRQPATLVDSGTSFVFEPLHSASAKEEFSEIGSFSKIELQRVAADTFTSSQGSYRRTRSRHAAEIESVRKLLVALLCAAALPDFDCTPECGLQDSSERERVSPRDYAISLTRYFALLLARGNSKNEALSRLSTDEEAAGFSPPTTVDPSIFLHSLVEVVSRGRKEQSRAGFQLLEEFIDSILEFSGCPVVQNTFSGFVDKVEATREAPLRSKTAESSGADDASILFQSGSGMQAGTETITELRGRDLNRTAENQGQSEMPVDAKDAANISRGPSTTRAAFVAENWVVPPTLSALVEALCHSCYQRSWYAKLAGAAGLGAIINRVPSKVFENRASPSYEAHVVRALMYVVRDLSEDMSLPTTASAKTSLKRLLELCHSREKTSSNTEDRELRDVTVCLTVELTSDSNSAREVAKEALVCLAETLGKSVVDIMSHVKEQILRPLQQRSIRQLSFPVQIGFIDAVTFCLTLERPMLASELFSSPIKNLFLSEVVSIAEDSTIEKLTEAEEGVRHRLIENQLIKTHIVQDLTQLRRKSVALLSHVSVKCFEYLQEPTNQGLYKRMVSSFFKSLQSKDEELVATAKAGLQQTISQHPRPKELQPNLRPMLANLGDYKKLTIPYLQGLSRVLELLSHWFNVSLGDKLLEHLQRWTDPKKLAQLSKVPPGTESRVGAAILDLFYLLPPGASKFLSALVYMVIMLESNLSLVVAGPGVAHLGLRGSSAASTSPYREPLLKFCNRHSKDAISFFYESLQRPKIRNLFFRLLNSDGGSPLRSEIASRPAELIRATFENELNVSTNGIFAYYGVAIMNSVFDKSRSDWLKNTPSLMASFMSHWKSPSRIARLQQEQSIPLEQIGENRIMVEILTRHCEYNPQSVEILFYLLQVFSFRTACDFTFLKNFFSQTVAKSYSVQNRKAILSFFLSFFASPDISQERKVSALQYIIIPMLNHHLQNRSLQPIGNSTKASQRKDDPGVRQQEMASALVVPDSVLDHIMLGRIVTELLNQPDDVLRSYDEPLSAELLQLATLLIRHMPIELAPFRKEVIKFGWAHLKREDSIAKQWAFVNVSSFFDAYQAPPKIILQVYVALLRAVQGDGRHLVRQALDILTPALPRRLEHNTLEHKYPIWIRYTKKVLLEEGHSVTHLVHIWQLVVRHSDLFYVARAQLVPLMVNSLARIGLSANAQPENRRLALDLADLVIFWDKRGMLDEMSHDSGADGFLVGRKRQRLDTSSNRMTSSHEEPTSKSSNLDEIRISRSVGLETEPPTKIMKMENGDSVAVQGPITATRRDAQDTVQTGDARDSDDFRPHITMVEIVVNFLAQVAFRQMERRERDVITKRCTLLIDRATEIWPQVNVKLSFLERFLDGSDRGTPQATGQNPSTRPKQVPGHSSATGTNAASPADPKASTSTSKAEAAKAEKLEQQRVERAQIRKAGLITALEICLVLSDRQSASFAALNAGILRVMISPSLSDRDIQAAALFSKLLRNLLKKGRSLLRGAAGGNIPGQGVNSNRGPQQAASNPSSSKAVPLSMAQAAMKAINVSKPQAGVGPHPVITSDLAAVGSVRDPQGTPGQATNGFSLDTFCGLVLQTSDPCLRANDAANHVCGLLAIEAVVDGRPGDFVKVRDLLLKSIQRMVKEYVQGVQAAGMSGNITSTLPAQGGGSNAGTSRGTVPSQDKGNVSQGAPGAGNLEGMATVSRKGGSVSLEDSQGSSGLSSISPNTTDGVSVSNEIRALILCISLLGKNIGNLEASQRRAFLSSLAILVERCTEVNVLLEIVRVVRDWVKWKPKVPPGAGEGRLSNPQAKDPLSPKEKANLLLRMTNFEKITGSGSADLMNSYLDIVLCVFGFHDLSERRPELVQKLERPFLLGLKSNDSSIRGKFFKLFDGAINRRPLGRLHLVLAKQDWQSLADSFWIRQATELLLAAIDSEKPVLLDSLSARLPRAVLWKSLQKKAQANAELLSRKRDIVLSAPEDPAAECLRSRRAKSIYEFLSSSQNVQCSSLSCALRQSIYEDDETAYLAWISLFPCAWSLLKANTERSSMENALGNLLVKEYHIAQVSRPRNVIQALLDGASRCNPQPPIQPEVLLHLGSRWNAWHTVLPYLENRRRWLAETLSSSSISDRRTQIKYEREREAILDSSAELYRLLNEKDFFAGVWKGRAVSNLTVEALSSEQRGQFGPAQKTYADCMLRNQALFSSGYSGDVLQQNGHRGESKVIGKSEICLWEERWCECAQQLCQWDVLNEFSRSVVQTDLLHECLWRHPDWSGLKELLYKHPIEDGPKLKLYQAYIQLQENKLETAENCINMGYQRALDRYCSFPNGAGSDCVADVVVQFQQFVELQESSKILAELNALSRHGNGGINVEQKIENVRLILNGWRERLPAPHESLLVWNRLLMWRNHVHAVVVSVLENLKEAANARVAAANGALAGGGGAGMMSNARHIGGPGSTGVSAQVQAAAAIAQALPQQVLVMGVNDTAWNVHRFARACRKQCMPEIAIHALQKLYPFGTMELTEYFVKTKEVAKSYIAGPEGVENSLHYALSELNRCNMDHFNPRQKAQLFTMKGKIFQKLGQDDNATDAFSLALRMTGDVGSAWLAWGRHCDAMQAKASRALIGFEVEGEVLGKSETQAKDSKPAVSPRPIANEDISSQWREAAINCYLQAVRFGSRKARCFLPRSLRLLTIDAKLRKQSESSEKNTATVAQIRSAGASSNQEKIGSPIHGISSAAGSKESDTNLSSDASKTNSASGAAGSNQPSVGRAGKTENVFTGANGAANAFFQLTDLVPSWVWLPWISQLVAMLAWREAGVAHAILGKIIQQYPQAVFFPLRSFLEERKSLDSPERSFVAEALKSSRPNTSALLPAASSAQLNNYARQAQVAKENLRKAYQAVQISVQKQSVADAAAAAKRDTPEYPALAAQASRYREKLLNTKRIYERCLEAHNQAQKRQIHASQQVGAGSSPATSQSITSLASIENGHGQNQLNIAPTEGTQKFVSSGNAPTSNSFPVKQETSQVGSQGNVQGTIAAQTSGARSQLQGDNVPNVAAQSQETQNIKQASATGIQQTQAQVSSASDPRATQQGQSSRVRQLMHPRPPHEHADLVMARLVMSHQGLYVEIERIAKDLAHRMKPQQEEQLLGLMNALLHRCYQLSVQTGKEVAPSLRSALEDVSRMCFNTVSDAKSSATASHNTHKIQASIIDLKPAFEAEMAPQTAKDFPTHIEPFIARLRRWKNIFQKRVDSMTSTQKLENLSRHLIEVHDSDVEVFGQYLVAEAAEPNLDSHAKISRFSADVRVVRRHSGAARGITLLGSDGRDYHFVLEASANAVCQPTEERAAQLCRLINASFLARYTESRRRCLSVEVPKLISTGQHTRLVSDDPSFSSLADGLERHMESTGGTLDDPLMAFRHHASKAYNRGRVQSSVPGGREESVAARVEAYHAVCNSHVPDSCLSEWVASRISSPNSHFLFRKTFAESLGVTSLVSYALAVGARRPQNILFSWASGTVYFLHMRPLISSRGIIESDEAVPFRLTRNLRRLLGSAGISGPFFGSMAVALSALRSNEELLETYLESIMHDELGSWVSARADAVSKTSSAGSTSNALSARGDITALEDRVKVSVASVLQRLNPSKFYSRDGQEETLQADDISKGISALITLAEMPENLAKMESSWQAWF